MDGTLIRPDENMVTIDLDELGKGLNISSTGDEMRLLICPGCDRHYIRQLRKEVKFAKCVCGAKIELRQRWYD